jgi:putative inorganic carbon (HCO3(-)) transporter
MNLDFATLLLLAILGLFLLAIAISRPELGLAALIIVVYTNLSDVLISRFGFPSIAQPLVGLLGVVILARWVVFQDTFEGWTKLAILLGIYTFLGYLSIFYASDVALAKETLIYYLKNAIIGLVVILLLKKEDHLKWAVWSLLAAGIFMGSISTYQVFTGHIGNTYWGFGRVLDNGGGDFRLWGSIGDANYYAQIMVALIPFAVERFLHEKKLILRFLSVWAIFVFLVTIYYTFSRGGFLALLVVGFLIFARQPSRPYTGLILLGILLFVGYQFVPAQYSQRIGSLFQLVPGENTTGKIDTSLQGRTSASIIGWTMFSDYPVLGVGVGNFNANFDRYARQLGLSHEAGSAHNLYLEIAAERGLVGLLSFIAILYFTFRVLQRTKVSFLRKNFQEMANICDALTASLAGYLVGAAFLHDAHIRYLWLLLGIAWSVPQVLSSLVGEPLAEDRLNSLKIAYNE